MADGFVLLASVFYQRQENGSRKRYRQGDVVVGLDDAAVARLLGAGVIGKPSLPDLQVSPEEFVAVMEASAENPPPFDVEPLTPPAAPVQRPAKIATKAVLVDWLVANAGLDRAELGDQSKDDLWALVEATD